MREHFQAAVPENADLDAVVYARLNYSYSYEQRTIGQNCVIKCTNIVCCGEQLPDRSWMREEAPRDLIDHEQGHFDIAELIAKKAQMRLRYLVRKEKLFGKAATAKEAEAELVKRLRIHLGPFDRELAIQNDAYDRQTEHGRNVKEQRAARREQKRQLRELSKRKMPRSPVPNENASQ